MTGSSKVLHRLETSLREVGARGRETVRTRGFDVFISQEKSYHMSFAVPLEIELADWSEAVTQMVAAFASRGKRARLEYFHELHLGLADTLGAAGFKLDMSAPVMTLTPEALAAPPKPKGDYFRLTPERKNLEDFLRKQSVAYGGSEGEGALEWLDNLQQGLQRGSVMAAGLKSQVKDQVKIQGGLVSGASIQIGGDAGELAGVWTSPSEQQRGVAFELCQRLLSDYFQAGHTLCWLSAAAGAQRLYEKLGFQTVGTQLNYGYLDR